MKAFGAGIVVVFVIGFTLGQHIGAYGERHWPTPPPGKEICVIPAHQLQKGEP